ncbi:hypothetical protein SLEP1_g24728 [Rubroshorea leprosula]|uniref:Uncharacterized protein n=1 Tax=Rubroshorea leprosula TaxID=152421 RepID=A0AAV5JGS6_9ROSI|nr:hypothetical protein SLEP1_g24728 [Rubroshorea leprosula]
MFQTPIDPSVESISVCLQDRSVARSSSNLIEMFYFLLIRNADCISRPRSVFLGFYYAQWSIVPSRQLQIRLLSNPSLLEVFLECQTPT